MNFRAACCILVLALQPCVLSLGYVRAQERPRTYREISPATYDKVLDLLFQREETDRHYDFVLRFEPSNAPESQLFIKQSAKKTQVVEFTSLSGNIYAKLDSILQKGGQEDAVEMAKQLRVRRRILEVPAAEANQWWSGLPAAMGATVALLQNRGAKAAAGVGTITLDGTYYSFWYDQVGSKVFVRLSDHEVSSQEVTGTIELVRWMNRLRCDIEKMK